VEEEEEEEDKSQRRDRFSLSFLSLSLSFSLFSIVSSVVSLFLFQSSITFHCFYFRFGGFDVGVGVVVVVVVVGKRNTYKREVKKSNEQKNSARSRDEKRMFLPLFPRSSTTDFYLRIDDFGDRIG